MTGKTGYGTSFDISRVRSEDKVSGQFLKPYPYRKSGPDVLVVESTKGRPHLDTPVAQNGPFLGRILR